MGMYKKGIIILAIVAGAALLVGTFMTGRGSADGHIIMTHVPVQEDISSVHDHGSPDGYRNARIVRIDPENPESSFTVLTPGFASAMSPELSMDNQHLVFAGKKKPDENWRIWVMNPKGSGASPITGKDINCFDPVFLPDERIAFSCSRPGEKTGGGSTLYASQMDGSEFRPLTFHPHSDYAGTVLHDGRILMISWQQFPESGTPKLLAMRPDGTNAGLFFEIPENYTIQSRARENADRSIFFVAADRRSGASNTIIRFSYNNPYLSTETLRMSESGQIHSLYPAGNGSLLVSYRDDHSDSYGLFEYDPETGALDAPVYLDQDYHVMEPVVVQEKPFVPKKLPTALNFTRDSGLMVFTENTPPDTDNGGNDATKIQILGIDGLMSEFVPAADGSFYLEVAAQTPVRFQRLNGQNEVLNGPTSWFWLMPGERRGFAGWDERRTIAPPNRVPEAINHPPEQVTADSGSVSFVESIEANVLKEVVYED